MFSYSTKETHTCLSQGRYAFLVLSPYLTARANRSIYPLPYAEFCKIADKQRALYGLTKQAIQETIRICLERGILVPFLTAKREEVVDIMEMLFNQEEVCELTLYGLTKQAVRGYH